jgi:hypothetical protein
MVEPLRVETIPPDTEIVLWDKPEGGAYVVGTYIGGRPAFAGHHQRLDEATLDFEGRVARRRGGDAFASGPRADSSWRRDINQPE